MIRWTEGNTKLVKTSGEAYNIIGYGIPADYDVILMGQRINTCPGASACRAVCYAKQGRYLMPNVRDARAANVKASILPSFINNAVSDLGKRRKYNTVRIHDSGDFYSQEYYDKWCEIARRLPDRIFYAYTKSMHLDLWTNKPDNLRIIQSLGGKHDNLVDLSKPHSRIFSSHEAAVAAGYTDGTDSDLPAIEGVVKIALIYHGVRKLTLAQVKFFS